MPGKNKDTKSSSISRNLHWVTRPSASIRDLALWGADVLGAPSHITNAVRDVSNRVANLPIIGLDAAYNYATGNNSTWEDAFKEADTNPSALASAFEVFPITNTESNYSDAQLANQYELRKHSPGKPGQITYDGYRYINQGRYAGDIGTVNFFSPSKVNEWSIGQTSGIADEEGNTYTSDLFAYDTKDTNNVYLKAIKEGKASPAMFLRGALGVVGAKGYDDGTNSATAIRTKIDTKAQKRAYDGQNKKAEGGSLRSSWNDLSLAEKSEMMKVAIKNGIIDLSTIRQKYNEFAEGGPEETYNVGYIPEVTIEAERKNNPYIYYDPWSRRYKGIGVGGQRIEYGEGFNPEGSILLPDAKSYENQRLIRAKQDDLNHTYDFGNKMRNAALFATVAPMAGPLVEAAQAAAPYLLQGAKQVLTPGSNFWNNPTTRQIVTSTLGGTAVDAGQKLINGKTWGENVATGVNALTRWNPQDTWYGTLLTDMTNPGYMLNLSMAAPVLGAIPEMWNAGKKGLQYTTKAIDNAARYASPSYDLYRTVGETTPRTTPTYHGFRLNGEQAYTGSPLFEFGKTMRTSPEKAYFMRAPKNIDILKLENGRFRHKVVGNEVLPSGEVNGKFVSYGEPWKEFALGENSALYEFPVGPRRGPSLMATDFRGSKMDYSVDEAYNAVLRDRQFHQDIKDMELDDILQFKRDNYPDLIGGIPTDIYHANQTVIPNERWNFDKFLKTPFWKYSENPISGQVQKELMMRWPEAKPLETSTMEWADATRTPQITAENAASMTPEQWTAAQDAAIAKALGITPEEVASLSKEQIDVAIARNPEIQRLRDLRFKVSAPNTKVKEAVFNGSLSDKPFYEFNTNFRDAYWGGRNDYTTGAWFGTGDENTLLSFAGDNPNRLKKFYLNFSNPFIKDAGYRRWDKLLPFNMTEEDIAIEAAKLREKGFPEYVIEDWKNGLKTTTDNYALKLETTDYDSGIIKNVYENKAHPDSEYEVITDYIASKPNQIKSADAVTFDNNGRRIGLGDRDNFNVNDTRYSWLPWFLGGTTAATVYNSGTKQ